MQLTELVDKITADFATDSTEAISENTELLMSGIIDSLAIMNLVTWIEDRVQAEIDPGDVVIENFESPAAIMMFTATLSSAQPA